MADLIRREDAIKAYNEAMTLLVEAQMKEWELADFSECEFNTTDCKLIARKIDAIPSVDIAEDCQKHYRMGIINGIAKNEPRYGEWINVGGFITPGGDPVWKCSECGKGRHVYGIEHASYGSDISDGQWVACPNCGAVMREDNSKEGGR